MSHKIQSKADEAISSVEDEAKSRARITGAIEASARADIMRRAAPPAECGGEIPVAPARGPMVAFTPRMVGRTDAGNYRATNAGYMGRRAARIADAFDQMTRDAVRAHRRGRVDAAFVAPFTVGQVEMGREYAALVERVSGSGVRCSSMEASDGGDGSGGGMQDAVFRDIQRLRVLRRRIGNGIAKRVVRRGTKRRAILDRVLVDKVCVECLPIETVLRAHGWGVDAAGRAELRRALCGALDRMRGYGLASKANGAAK